MDTADGSYRLYDYVDGILQTCTGCTDESILRDDESSTANKELTTPYSATIRGRQDIDIYPQVSGTIERLCVTEGEVVRKDNYFLL